MTSVRRHRKQPKEGPERIVSIQESQAGILRPGGCGSGRARGDRRAAAGRRDGPRGAQGRALHQQHVSALLVTSSDI